MNILIVRIGRLGDVVMILPALIALKNQYPNATFYALTTPDGARLLKASGLIHPSNIMIYRHTFWAQLSDKLKVKSWFKALRLQAVYCFEFKAKTPALLPKGYYNLKPTDALVHYSERCLELVNANQMINPPYLNPSNESRLGVLARLDALGIHEHTILIGFHPTYSGFGKWFKQSDNKHRLWPIASFAALAVRLRAYGKAHGLDIRVVMDLLPDEAKLGQRIVDESEHCAELLQVSRNFHEYLAYLSRLNVLIAPNTGVMHLGAALSTPLVALFSKLQPEDCGPYPKSKTTYILKAEESSSPSLGLAGILVDEVFQRVISLIPAD